MFCIVPNVSVYICPRYWERDLFLRVTPGVHSPFRSLVAPTRSMHSRPSAHHTVVCFASTVPTSTPTPSRLRHVTSREVAVEMTVSGVDPLGPDDIVNGQRSSRSRFMMASPGLRTDWSYPDHYPNLQYPNFLKENLNIDDWRNSFSIKVSHL